MSSPDLYYSDYLELNKILESQHPKSFEDGKSKAHDEMLFIIIHQAYELWFKQIMHEINSVLGIMKQPEIDDNSSELQSVVHRLSRVVTILKVLVHQVDIMETMTPLDFLDFRDMLRPASGFQSWQFKVLEAKLGLRFEDRHGKEYYISHLKENDIKKIKEAEKERSLLELLNAWLERMPFVNTNNNENIHPFWNEYREKYVSSLAEAEKNNLESFDNIFLQNKNQNNRLLSSAASRSALFIILYRGYPVLELPFELLNVLLEIDEQLSTWRYRHMNMVRRMIGSRIGTGGSSGSDYLKAALDKHYIFKELTQLNSFLIERRNLPQLPEALTQKLGFKI